MDIDSSPHLSIYGKTLTSEITAPGDLWGAYEIVDVLSVTLLGTLYRVKHQGEIHCLHVFPSGISKDAAFAEKIKETVEKQRKISIPELLKPLEVIHHEKFVAVLFEPFEGDTLSNIIRVDGTGFDPDQSTAILKSISNAMQVARNAGLNHLALSGEMVLYGKDHKIKLYGLNFFSSFARRRFEIFVSSAIIPIYSADNLEPSVIDILSPEIRNEEEFDERAEIFGIGLLAYYLLTGKSPRRDWILPSKAVEGLDEGWDYLISKCLENDPEDRFATLELLFRNLGNVDELCEKEVVESTIWRKLEKIPLPRKVVSRFNTQTLRIIRLAILGVFGFLIVGTAASCYQLIFGESEGHSGSRITEVGEHEKANLILHFDQPRVLVKFLGEGGGSFLVQGGQLRLRGDFRDFIVTVAAPQYETKRFSVSLNKTLQERTIVMEIAWGLIKIKGIPGSRIDVITEEGKRAFLGLIPDSGEWEATDRLFTDTYDFAVSLRGHEERIFKGIELSEKETKEIDARLDVLPASLSIVSHPLQVPVYINGLKKGETPLVLEDLFSTEPLEIELKGEGLRTRSNTITLQPGEENQVDFGNLEIQSGTLSLAIKVGKTLSMPTSELELLTVTIEGETYKGVDRINRSFPAGSLALRVNHPSYLPYTGTVEINDLKATETTVILTPRPGIIEIGLTENHPYGISIDGVPVQAVNHQLTVTPQVEHLIRLVVRDFEPFETTLVLKPNETYLFEPKLKPLAGPTKSERWIVPYLDIAMSWAPEGIVEMGSSKEEALRLPNEERKTQVKISQGFWVAQFEITQKVYEQVMGKNPSQFKGETYPVEQVSYDDALEFCRRLSIVERRAGRIPQDYTYRLPTEAEWEYFCRAEAETIFTWGNTADSSLGNFQGTYPRDFSSAEISTQDDYGTTAVGTYKPNGWGIYDLHGNVREWVLDGYNDRHPGGKKIDFYLKENGVRGRTIKGGGWEDFAHRCRVAARDPFKPEGTSSSLGFRIVLAPALP